MKLPNVSALSAHFKSVLQWERDVGIFDFQIDGVPIWRLIRNDLVIADVVAKKLELAHNQNALSARSIISIAKGTLLSLWHIIRIPRADVLVWSFPRRQRTEDGWIDPLTDPLIDNLSGKSAISIERPLQGRHSVPATSCCVVWYDAPKVMARFRAFVPNTFSANEMGVIDALSSVISARFDIPLKAIRKQLARELAAFQAEKSIARYILKRAQPNEVLVVNRWVNAGVIAACHDFGIKVYEAQHGAVGKEGFKYHTPYSARLDPTGFLTFGNDWTHYDWGLPATRIHNIGAPYIWAQRQRQEGLTPGKSIMLVSQPNQTKNLLKIFADICVHFPEHTFLLQLHPQDRQNGVLLSAFNERPNVTITPRDTPLYQSFSACQAVIGQDSTVLVEASFFNLKVGLLNLPNALDSGIREKIGTYNFFDAQDVASITQMLLSPRQNEAIDGNGYFDPLQVPTLHRLFQIDTSR